MNAALAPPHGHLIVSAVWGVYQRCDAMAAKVNMTSKALPSGFSCKFLPSAALSLTVTELIQSDEVAIDVKILHSTRLTTMHVYSSYTKVSGGCHVAARCFDATYTGPAAHCAALQAIFSNLKSISTSSETQFPVNTACGGNLLFSLRVMCSTVLFPLVVACLYVLGVLKYVLSNKSEVQCE